MVALSLFFHMALGDFINADSTLPWRILGMILGCVILSIGMSIVIKSNAGTGPNDLIAIILTDKLQKFQFRWVRMTCDFIFCYFRLYLRWYCWYRYSHSCLFNWPTCAVLAS